MSRTGLCAQFGFKQESTYGTAVTVDHFQPVVNFVPDAVPIIARSEAVRGCARGPLSNSAVVVGQKASGTFTAEVRSRGWGLLFGQALGAAPTPTQISSTARYRQIHLLGTLVGRSLTMQAGFPESYSDTIRPHTYEGVKFSQFVLQQQRNALLKASVTWDGQLEAVATALATDTYPTDDEIFSYNGFSAKIGGTATTGSGRTTIADGVELKGCRGVTVTINNSLATERYQSGGSGSKSEQLETGIRTVMVDLDLEYADRTQVYDLIRAFTQVVLQLEWTGQRAIETAVYPQLRLTLPITCPAGGGPRLDGPDVLPGPAQLEAYEDHTGTHPFAQLEYESADTSL